MAIAAVSIMLAGCDRGQNPEPIASAGTSGPVDFVGRDVCASCHEQEHERWQGSHHDLAMQKATASTVLGDFADTTFTYYGVTSTFYRRDGKFFVRTDGQNGELQDHEIAYVFGVAPLQQYLIELPGGRYQALSLCWDSRPAGENGQRWFHLYPEREIAHDDPLHWTGREQNWNYMCAECHSTNLVKNYSPAEDSYETSWSEIDVSCEACHGPGSRHVAWAEGGKQEKANGLAVQLKSHDDGNWIIDPETGMAARSPRLESQAEIETCARCHSRRSTIHTDYEHGKPFLDTHRLALLNEELYHADGQIKEEVYVYGSFLQSKMYDEGVTCRDCHDPHGLEVLGSPDAVCSGCHLPARFASREHHFHEENSPGASCVECHMPSTTYMVVDPRRDHSFRVPRPDLSVLLGTPNACTGCHGDRRPEWAAEIAEQWYGPRDDPAPHYGVALDAGRKRLPHARRLLEQLALDSEMPSIARASALSLLRTHVGPAAVPTIERALGHGDPLVRAAGLGATESLDSRERPRLAFPLLDDPVRAVRIEAARVLASLPAGDLPPTLKATLDRGLAEYRAAQMANAERPESLMNLAWLHAQLGEDEQAERVYREALSIQPGFGSTYVNLADLYRRQGRDAEGEQVLRRGIELLPEDGDLRHALGLLLVRVKRLPEALVALRAAAELRPGEPRYGYVLGVALFDSGETEQGLGVLKATHGRHPADPSILMALASFSRRQGSIEDAVEYARRLVLLAPRDPGARRLLDTLEAELK